MKKRILILATQPPQQLGGAETLIRELATGFEARGYEVEVLHRVNCAPASFHPWAGWLGRQLDGALVGYWVGRQAQQRLGQDVAAVISHGTVGFYPLKGRGAPLKQIHFYHGTYRGQAEAIRPWISFKGYLKLKWWDSMLLERWSGRGKRVFCNSEQTREEVRRYFGHKGSTVWLPLNTALFRPLSQPACRASLGLPATRAVGLFVGSTHPQKGFAVVRALIATLPEVLWLLALRGDVPADLAGASGIRVLRDVPYEQLPTLYGAADFSVCPSSYEPFGYVVAEALACGTPAIATSGGASELFLRQPPLDRLLIADPSAVEDFRKAIHEVLADPARFRKLVLEHVRPRVQELMAPANWWARFLELAGL